MHQGERMHVLRRNLRISSWKTFLLQIDGLTGEKIKYADIPALVETFASHLLNQGFQKGDVLCVFAPNHVYYPVLYLGVLMLGGVVTDVNPLYTKGKTFVGQTSQKIHVYFSASILRYAQYFTCLLSILPCDVEQLEREREREGEKERKRQKERECESVRKHTRDAEFLFF